MGTHPIFESDFDCLTDRMNDYVRRLASKDFPPEAIPAVTSSIKHRIMKSVVTSEQRIGMFTVKENLRQIPISPFERQEIVQFYTTEASIVSGTFILPRFLRIFRIDSRFFKLATGFSAGFILTGLYISLVLPSKIQSFVGMDRGYPKFIPKRFSIDKTFRVTRQIQEDYFQSHPSELAERAQLVFEDSQYYLDSFAPKSTNFAENLELNSNLKDSIDKEAENEFDLYKLKNIFKIG